MTTRGALLSLVSLVSLVSLAWGCGGGKSTVDPAPVGVAVEAPGPATMPGDARAAHAFRPHRGGFATTGRSYRAEVDASGTIALRSRGTTFSLATEHASPRSVALDGRGGVRYRDPDAGVTERIVAQDDSIEQSWTFDHLPIGSGPFRARVATHGAAFERQDAAGLHFRAPRGTFLYGAATFVDARGAKTRIPLAIERSSDAAGAAVVAIDVPRDVLERAAYPAVLDPSIGPETPDGAPVIVPAPVIGNGPAAVAGAGEVLTAWVQGNAGIVGVRIDLATGLVRPADAGGVTLVPDLDPVAPGSSTDSTKDISAAPGLAWDGAGTYLVAWVIETDYGSMPNEVRVARIDATTGRVIASDVGGIVVATSTAFIPNVDVDWNGTDFLVRYHEYTGGVEGNALVRFDPVTGAAVAGDGSGVPITTSTLSQDRAEAACSPTDCGLVWWEATAAGTSNLMFAHVSSATGRADEPAGVVVVNRPTEQLATIAWDPVHADYLIVTTVNHGATQTLSGVLVPAGPTATIGALKTIATQTSADSLTELGLAFDGTSFVFGWQIPNAATDDADNLYALERIDPVTLAPGSAAKGGVTVLPGVAQATLAATSGTALAVGASPIDALVTARWSAATRTVATADVGGVTQLTSASDEFDAHIVKSTNGLLMAWNDSRATTVLSLAEATDVYVARLDPVTHVPLAADGHGIAVTSDHSSSVDAVATDGTNYFVIWHSTLDNDGNENVFGAIVNGQTGTVTTPVAYQTLFGLQNVGAKAAYGGGHYVMLRGYTVDVSASLVDPNTAALVGSPVVLTNGSLANPPTMRASPAIAFDGTNFLAAWEQSLPGNNISNPYARRITPALELLEEAPFPLSDAHFDTGEVTLAFGGGRYLAAWTDQRLGELSADVFGRIVLPDGTTPGADLAISETDSFEDSPTIADTGDGLSFQVAWATGLYNPIVMGTLVGYDGTVRQPGGVALAADASRDNNAWLTPLGAGTVLLAYDREDASAMYKSTRIHARTLSTGTVTGACTTNDDCATLHCVDGVCCDTACDGVCETCAKQAGTCSKVVSLPDPGTCSGTVSCNAEGACEGTLGHLCSKASDCVSGFCADGVCCNSACNGGCDVCNGSAGAGGGAPPGTCSVIAVGSSGTSPTCSPYVCDGVSPSCPVGCKADADCTQPFTCAESGTCTIPGGSICSDDHTVKSPSGLLKTCTPYACQNDSCKESCTSIEECAVGYVCDGHVCVAPALASSPSGCNGGGDDAPKNLWFPLAVAAAFFGARRRRVTIRQ